jgi:hypothetical protein
MRPEGLPVGINGMIGNGLFWEYDLPFSDAGKDYTG